MADISAIYRLKEKIKTITRKTIPASFDERIERLKRIITGMIALRLILSRSRLLDWQHPFDKFSVATVSGAVQIYPFSNLK